MVKTTLFCFFGKVNDVSSVSYSTYFSVCKTNRLPFLHLSTRIRIIMNRDQKRKRDASPKSTREESNSKKCRTFFGDMKEKYDKMKEELREMEEAKIFFERETHRLRDDRNYWRDKSDRVSSDKKRMEEQLLRDNSLLHREIAHLKTKNSACTENTVSHSKLEDGDIDDRDDNNLDIHTEVCDFDKDALSFRGRYKGIVIGKKTGNTSFDRTITSQSYIYSPTLGLLYCNNRKNVFMEMGFTYEFGVKKNKNIDKDAKNCIYTMRATDWHGITMSQIQPSRNDNFEATIDFHHCQIRGDQGENYVLHEALNKVTIGKRFVDRLNSKNWVRDVENPPSRQTMRIRAKVILIDGYLQLFKKDRKASIFKIKELVTAVDCHTGVLLPVEGLTAFR